jgi:hypothetical protein
MRIGPMMSSVALSEKEERLEAGCLVCLIR